MTRAYDVIEAKEHIIKLLGHRLVALNKELDEVAFTCNNTKEQLGKIQDKKSDEFKTVSWQMVQADLEFKCLKELYNKMLDAFNNCISRKLYDWDCCRGCYQDYGTDDEDYF